MRSEMMKRLILAAALLAGCGGESEPSDDLTAAVKAGATKVDATWDAWCNPAGDCSIEFGDCKRRWGECEKRSRYACLSYVNANGRDGLECFTTFEACKTVEKYIALKRAEVKSFDKCAVFVKGGK
jgi:hypothetical protein